MEPKVVSQALNQARRDSRWNFNCDRCYTKQGGAANNWAYGYGVLGEQVEDAVEDLVRKVSLPFFLSFSFCNAFQLLFFFFFFNNN